MARARAFAINDILPTDNYGDVQVIGYEPNRRYVIKFLKSGSIKTVGYAGLLRGKVKDDTSHVRVQKTQAEIGRHFQTNRDGFVEVIGKPRARHVTVRFIDTGFERECSVSALYEGAVSDTSKPYYYVNGGIKNPMKGCLNFQVGDTFTLKNGHPIEVLEIESSSRVLIKFHTGNTLWTRSQQIRLGSIYNCMLPRVCGVGFMGTYESADPIIYKVWKGMLERCYNEDDVRNKTYRDCTVYEPWHNYTTFASDIKDVPFFTEWYDSKKEKTTLYHFDKDILVAGNKIYGPGKVCFVSVSDNIIESQLRKFIKGTTDPRLISAFNVSLEALRLKYLLMISRSNTDSPLSPPMG